MEKIVIISAEIAGYNKPFGGQGVAALDFIDELKKKYRLQVITVRFKNQAFREVVDNVEVIRISTPLTINCTSFQDVLFETPKAPEILAYSFKKGILDYMRSRINNRDRNVVYLLHGWGEGLLSKPLKKLGYKIVIVFHWSRIQRYLTALFSKYIDMNYDLNNVTLSQRWMIKFARIIWKDEKEFIKFTTLFYRLYIKNLIPKKLRFYFESEIESLNFANQIFVLNEDAKSYFLSACPFSVGNKIKIVDNGISDDYFNLLSKNSRKKQEEFGITKGDIVFLFIGRIEPMKGLEYLIKAMYYLEQHLLDKADRIKLLIVGEAYGVYKHYLKKLIALSNGLKRTKVLFLGPVYGEDKLMIYDRSNIFVLPSVYEPFGLVILEAMARNKKIVSSSFCGASRLIKNSFGEVVDYANPSQRTKGLGDAIIRILQSNMTEMNEDARAEALKFKWDQVIRQYIL